LVRRFALDSNVLLYAELEPDSEKGERATALIKSITPQGVLAAQAIGEFLTVVRRRRPGYLEQARKQAEVYCSTFLIAPTDNKTVLAAAAFAQRYNLQLWDAVIWQASARAGAAVLFSEDMQDGFAVDGLRVVDPFALDPAALDAVLRG
jgi:predicted nucleic acid-binding protein